MLRDVRRVDTPNGGLTTILAGDCRQTLPVVRHGNRASILRSCMHHVDYFHSVTHESLRMNERVRRRVLEGDPITNNNF